MSARCLGSLALAFALGALLTAPLTAPVHAGEADVVAVEAVKDGAGVYRFHVTVAHGDTGWDHYADKWDVVAPDGTVLGTRDLLHPHENEQPFTRSLGGVAIPPGVTRVTLRAHDSVHGYGGREVAADLKP